MTRYYFDMRDNSEFIEDEQGVELASLDEVKTDAAQVLVEIARDVIRRSIMRTLAIEVRDDAGPVLKAVLRFEIEHVR